jgi:hypothetical protein
MRFMVFLHPDEWALLVKLAHLERRHPTHQAAYLIARALEEAKRQEAVSC